MLTPDERNLLVDLARCVKLTAWHVRQLCKDSEAQMELDGVRDNLNVIIRVLAHDKKSAG